MKRNFLLAALFASSAAFGQVCDVTYVLDVDTGERNVSTVTTQVYGVPMADVLDNHARGLRIINELSKVQDRGGPYNVEVSETRTCDGGVAVKVPDGGIMVKGVTLKDNNRIARMALKEADGITKRYEDRAAKGDKHGWDHSKAKKVKRDDLGKKI